MIHCDRYGMAPGRRATTHPEATCRRAFRPGEDSSMETPTAHRPEDLTFLDCDDPTSTVVYTAPSASILARRWTVVLDVLTGATACDCWATRNGRACWHRALVAAAWDAHPAASEARFMTSE